MSSKPTQTHTPSFTIISRRQCWLYSIRVQIKNSHFFHIKKKSIIISIVLVKFLTVVRWMLKIPSERGHKSASTTHQRVHEAIHCGNCNLASSGPKIGWICTQKASKINDCSLLRHLYIFPLRWVVCVVFTDCGLYIINILNQLFYLATFVRFYLSSATFNTFNTQWIQYGTTLHFSTGKDQKDNAWVVGHARLFWITRELRTPISPEQ